MLSPRFLRMQAEKCLRSALATTDLDSAADLKKMARDLESWANEAEFEDSTRAEAAVAGILYRAALNCWSFTWSDCPVGQV